MTKDERSLNFTLMEFRTSSRILMGVEHHTLSDNFKKLFFILDLCRITSSGRLSRGMALIYEWYLGYNTHGVSKLVLASNLFSKLNTGYDVADKISWVSQPRGWLLLARLSLILKKGEKKI